MQPHSILALFLATLFLLAGTITGLESFDTLVVKAGVTRIERLCIALRKLDRAADLGTDHWGHNNTGIRKLIML